MSDNFLETIKLLQICDDDKVALPTFLIFEPAEVPSIPGESTNDCYTQDCVNV